MAPQGGEREGRGVRDWSSLPGPALFCVLMHLRCLVDLSSVRRVCTAWKLIAEAGEAEVRASLPSLLFNLWETVNPRILGEGYSREHNQIYSMSEKRFYKRDQLAGMEGEGERDLVGCSHGYLIWRDLQGSPTAPLVIVDPFARTDFGAAFPAWPSGARHGKAYLTAPPTSRGCVLVLVLNYDGRLLSSRPGDREWTVYDYPDGWSLHGVTVSKGKAYGLTPAKLAVMEFLPGMIKVTHPEVEDLPFDGFHSGCVRSLASHGDELLAFLFGGPLKVDEARLFRLDWGRGRWVEANEMGGRALFANMVGCAVLEDPSVWGGEGDCVYFADVEGPYEDRWMRVFHPKDRRIERWSHPSFPTHFWLATCRIYCYE